jgi:serine/threonine protein kinase
MLGFMKCVVEAVAANGVQGLLEMVPGGKYIYKVGEDAIKRYREKKARKKLEDEVKELIVARADVALAVAKQAVEEAALQLSPREKELVIQYVSAIPEAARQSLKRKDDPTGTSLPFGFTVHEPADVVKLLPPFPPRFVPGEWVPGREDNWRLERRLGGGGFGEVWLARHVFKRSEKPRAVKFCTDPVARRRLVMHEKDLIVRVMEHAGEHPNIVPLLECHLTGETPWLMYEYVAGGTLADAIPRWQALAPDERQNRIVTALHTVAAAVGHCHALEIPIVHRDLKPVNVLLDGDVPRITDFGIGGTAVDYLIADEGSRGYVSMTGRLPSQLSGSYSLLYASPQQRNGERPDPRDDVHALGVIAYQMFTGDLTAAPGFDLADDLRDTGAPDALIALVGKSVSQKADRRPKDAREWEAALVALRSEKGKMEPTRAEPAPRVVPRVRTWSLAVRGTWSKRATGAGRGAWQEIGKTPMDVTCEAGCDYGFRVHEEATEEDFARLAVLHDFPRLIVLNLSRCKQLTDAGHQPLKGLTNLQERDLYWYDRWTNAGLVHLKGLTNLQELDLGGCEQLADAGLRHLRGLTALQKLNLSACERLTDAGLVHLTGLTALQWLSLRECERLTDAGLVHLTGLTNLQELDLYGCAHLSDAGLVHLEGLTNLQSLNLYGCRRLTDAGLAHLKGLTNLKDLNLYGCEWLTDVGLVHLKALTNLRELDLGACERLTDAGLVHLKGLTALQSLRLLQCAQLTDAGVASLKKSLPRCRITR